MKALPISVLSSGSLLAARWAILNIAPRSQPVGPGDKDSQSKCDASAALDSIFGDSEYESGSYSNPSEDDDDSDNSDDDAVDYEGQLPPEHYLAQAKSLNVSQLRQKRYSEHTEENLEETRMYWKR